ncbi:hypothetical protein [Ruegeria arenilitoris]|uniref:hypothetical protein n=1 Tax=Ruegeria arenilitoris TaxID=1173585 RepID=UPI00147AEAA0|nr:hypothetical protein [Ruegeria arenilitoris]
MALIFGRFDKAPTDVREALLDFVAAATKDERRAAAMSILDIAVDKEPNVTSKDLKRVVSDLLQEAIILGFIGRNVNFVQLSVQFEHFITPRPGWNGMPQGSDKIMTLAEISALHVTDSQNQSRHRRRDFNR